MMKKNLIAKMSVFLACVMLVCVALTGCGGLFGGNNSDPTPKEYTIQYSDDAGTHTLTVTEGMPYSLESVPYKYGYEFLGLYDAQTGGKQYVGANGASLAPYKDKENKVLFPQFKPIDYTVILDYGEAEIAGERSLTVAYNTNLPELPKNLTLAHNEFTGWYTEAGGKGTQVADTYGNLPVVSVLNEENFKLDDSKRVYLYAGFELEKYTVTFIFDGDIPSEEVKVPYNTPIGQVVPKTRNSEKQAGLTWSKSKGGEEFTGNITDDTVLYVKEWAPVIELNGNGADVTPIVARAGTTVSLPTPTKPLAKFLRWEDENGQPKDITSMPAESTTLNAVWQAKIELDENGGTDVDDISKPAGESISLPTPEKDGYLFAGWYTADKEQYTQTKMPSAGIALKAGWYKTKEKTVNLITGIEEWQPRTSPSFSGNKNDTFDLGIKVEKKITIKVKWHAYIGQNVYGEQVNMYVNFYTQKTISDSYLVTKINFGGASNPVRKVEKESVLEISQSVLYFSWYMEKYSFNWVSDKMGVKDFYAEVTYPDTTYLYL